MLDCINHMRSSKHLAQIVHFNWFEKNGTLMGVCIFMHMPD